MGGLGMQELLLILLVAMLVFGAGKLPEIGSGIGRSIKNFRKAMNEPEEVVVERKPADKASIAKDPDEVSAPRATDKTTSGQG